MDVSLDDIKVNLIILTALKLQAKSFFQIHLNFFNIAKLYFFLTTNSAEMNLFSAVHQETNITRS